jgi:hypothetical protein
MKGLAYFPSVPTMDMRACPIDPGLRACGHILRDVPDSPPSRLHMRTPLSSMQNALIFAPTLQPQLATLATTLDEFLGMPLKLMVDLIRGIVQPGLCLVSSRLIVTLERGTLVRDASPSHFNRSTSRSGSTVRTRVFSGQPRPRCTH